MFAVQVAQNDDLVLDLTGLGKILSCSGISIALRVRMRMRMSSANTSSL